MSAIINARKQSQLAATIWCRFSRMLRQQWISGNGVSRMAGGLFALWEPPLYVHRAIAGNTLDEIGLGSLGFGVEKLQSPLIVVLGHSRCGAVSAAVTGESVSGHIGEVVSALKPAVRAARDQPGDPVEQAIKANVELVVNRLKGSKSILATYVKTGRLKIVGARYDLATGRVELLP
jgi:carbonic anhydrase